MPPHIEATPMVLALGEIVRPDKPTKREVKRCARRIVRAKKCLSDPRSVVVALSIASTPEHRLAALELLRTACKRCGWCRAFDITPPFP